MLLTAKYLSQLSFGKLMEVYEEGNRENGAELAPDEPENCQIRLAEQDFYDYLRNSFFCRPGVQYNILVENDRYLCALRLEPFRDGLLLEALETAPALRGKGYARKLITLVLEECAQQGGCKVYSHVSKQNTASLHVHYACGFRIASDCAVYVDGSVNHRAYTLLREL